MSHEHEPQAERHSELSSDEEPGRLGEIERKLKKARPRPASVDAETLMQVALSAGVEPTIRKAPAAPIRRRRAGRGRLFRRVAAIAGSWACGLAVGVLATFVWMSRTPSTDDPPSLAAEHGTQLPAPAEQAITSVEALDAGAEGSGGLLERRSPRSRSPLEDDWLVMISSPRGKVYGAYGSNGPPLRAGMHLHRDAGDSWDDLPQMAATGNRRADRERDTAEASGGANSSIIARPEITRERLLEELLQEASGAVL